MAESKIQIMITVHERDLLLNETTAIGEDILSKIRIAEVVGDKIRFSIAPDDLDLLLDDLAFEANHADSKKEQAAFDRILDRLAMIFDDFTGAEEAHVPYIDLSLEGVEVRDLTEADKKLVHLMYEQIFGFTRKPLSAYLDEPEKTLGGLTAKQVRTLNSYGWWGVEPPIRLNTNLGLTDFAASRFLKNARIFLMLLHEAGGAPLTIKGNLTRKFVGQMLEQMDLKDGYKEEVLQYNKVVNEMDLWPLHILRLVCSLAKLIRKFKKRYVITKQGLSLLAKENAGQLCANLFDAFFTKFSLAYLDGLPDVHDTIQGFFPYSLYRLSLLDADKEYSISDLPAVLLPPLLVKDLDLINKYVKAEDYIRYRFLRPLEGFGLLTIRRTKEPGDFIEMNRYVRKTALFKQFIIIS